MLGGSVFLTSVAMAYCECEEQQRSLQYRRDLQGERRRVMSTAAEDDGGYDDAERCEHDGDDHG